MAITKKSSDTPESLFRKSLFRRRSSPQIKRGRPRSVALVQEKTLILNAACYCARVVPTTSAEPPVMTTYAE